MCCETNIISKIILTNEGCVSENSVTTPRVEQVSCQTELYCTVLLKSHKDSHAVYKIGYDGVDGEMLCPKSIRNG